MLRRNLLKKEDESLETTTQEEVEKHPEKMIVTQIARRTAKSSALRMVWTTTRKLI